MAPLAYRRRGGYSVVVAHLCYVFPDAQAAKYKKAGYRRAPLNVGGVKTSHPDIRSDINAEVRLISKNQNNSTRNPEKRRGEYSP